MTHPCADPRLQGSRGVAAVAAAIEARTIWCRQELDPQSRAFFNFRDFQHAWPQNPDRVLSIVRALAKLPAASRPTGLLYEDQNGSWLPAIMCEATEHMRGAMVDNGWAMGHLLLHVHKGFGLSDASQLAAIGAGATGIWCGVSANGAMTGHASSIITLTNLARLGNRHVRARFNFVGLHNAAITINEVCTKEPCPPYHTEVSRTHGHRHALPPTCLLVRCNHFRPAQSDVTLSPSFAVTTDVPGTALVGTTPRWLACMTFTEYC